MQTWPGVSCFMLENYCMKATLLPGNDTATGGTQTVTPTNPRYPLTNLLNEQRSERWRTPEATSEVVVQFDMGTNVKPNTFALIDASNFDAPTIIGAASPDFTSSPVTLNFGPGGNKVTGGKLIEPMSRVQMWHNDDTDQDGVTFTGKRYWQVKFQSPPVSPYSTECGVVWMGRRFEVPIETRFRIQGENNSAVANLDSGARYFDRRARSRSINCVTSSKETKDMQDFRNAVELAAPGAPVLCDIYAFSGTISSDVDTGVPSFMREGRLYGYVDSRTGWEQRTVKVGRYSFTIDEAIA